MAEAAQVSVYRPITNITLEHVLALRDLAEEQGIRTRNLPRADRLEHMRVVLLGNRELQLALHRHNTYLEDTELVDLGWYLQGNLPSSAAQELEAPMFPAQVRTSVSQQQRQYHTLYVGGNATVAQEALEVQAQAASFIQTVTHIAVSMQPVPTRGYFRLDYSERARGAESLQRFSAAIQERSVLPPVLRLGAIAIDIRGPDNA